MTTPVAIHKKVCLLSDFAVGKTSLVRRFVDDDFDDEYCSTVGVKVSRKGVDVARDGETTEVTMMLWDLAGSEELDHGWDSYLHGAAGAVLVCDLTRPETLNSVREYAESVCSASPGARLILAANKQDVAEELQVTSAELEAVAADLDAPCYLTSAKTGAEVDALFDRLGQMLVGID